ncbi:MAG: XRE family transcriptional regulator [Proteobacteria bacterium]|nr:XRE family transcriptional regulator [Pseudomonadota bacterium]
MPLNESKSVSQRIREAREERGVDVGPLVELAGCSGEYLQWVEDGRAEPPVSLLLQLARALKMDSGAFLIHDPRPEKQMQEAAKRTDHYSYQTLAPTDASNHLLAFSVNIPPQTTHRGVGYQHEGEEFVYVLCGEIEATVGRKSTHLTAGQSLHFNSCIDHHLSNPGDREAELMVILYVP